eukprot:UN23801
MLLLLQKWKKLERESIDIQRLNGLLKVTSDTEDLNKRVPEGYHHTDTLSDFLIELLAKKMTMILEITMNSVVLQTKLVENCLC